MKMRIYSMAVIVCVMLVFSLAMPEGARAEEGQPRPRPRQELKEGQDPSARPSYKDFVNQPGPQRAGSTVTDIEPLPGEPLPVNYYPMKALKSDTDITADQKECDYKFISPAYMERPCYNSAVLPPGQILYRDSHNYPRLYANEAELGDVLKVIGEKAGIKVLVGDDLKGQKFHGRVEKHPGMKMLDDGVNESMPEMVHFDADTIEELVKDKIFYAFTYGEDGKVKEAAIGNVPGAAVEHRRIVIPYGDGPGEVGAGDGAYEGPLDFTVDDKGIIYILDTFGKRVQIYDNDGRHVGTVPLEEDFGKDIIVYGQYLYVYTDSTPASLTQYDHTGKVINKLNYDHYRRNPAGKPSFFWRGGIYVCMDFRSLSERLSGSVYELIAKIEGGVLRNSKFEDENRYIRGVMGRSGKIYSDGITYNGEYKIALKDSPEEEEITSVVKDMRTISRRELHSLHPLGDDDEGNIYYSVYRDSRTEILVFGGNNKIKHRFPTRYEGFGKTVEVGMNHTLYTLSHDKQCVINIYKVR